jgi:hypothetical protein
MMNNDDSAKSTELVLQLSLGPNTVFELSVFLA